MKKNPEENKIFVLKNKFILYYLFKFVTRKLRNNT